MSDGTNYMKYGVVGVMVLGIGLVAWRNFGPSDESARSAQIVAPPQLSAAASLGKKGYDDNCAQCHGGNAAGTDKGPPLVHAYYNPGHHGDEAFYMAVARGVRQHHWRFGNMPPQPQVTQGQAQMIIAYVREVQVANGITYQPH
ncbi:MAG: cytochrome c [Proteobacteria bacterium]|nr:cytochrome c [Pseudomonadota bacterium]